MQIKNVHLFKIILTSILIALNIVLERLLAYSVWNQTVSFSFITVAFAVVLLGTPYGVVVAALGDLIGALLIPFGPYFPGFTLTNALVALTLGLFISKKTTFLPLCIAVVINKILYSLVLNSLWITWLYKDDFSAYFTVIISRIPQSVLMATIEIIGIYLLLGNKSPIRQTIMKHFLRIV